MSAATLTSLQSGHAVTRTPATGVVGPLAWLQRLLTPTRTETLNGLADWQLRDIGVEPALLARIGELRSFDAFHNQSGRVRELLTHRSPAS